MDDGLRDYLDVRFCSIDKRLQLMQSAIDELNVKIDIHGDRLVAAERDITHLSEYVHTDRRDAKERREDCLSIMDKKDAAIVDKIKYWVAISILGGVASLLGFGASLLIRIAVK